MDLGATSLKNLYSGNVIGSCLPLKNIKTIKVYVRTRIFKRGSSDAENHRQSTLPSIGERRKGERSYTSITYLYYITTTNVGHVVTLRFNVKNQWMIVTPMANLRSTIIIY
ncbi:hypothetical protein OSB04_031501 [Centaurea solstitialis]|uniref:Uncharacterized protein n=1 Tax=Centaurea solstitialis TaxID=347529 RepID=A0AA38SAH4_9ASTR|nr:hypothetical protein OSB04_031501 [Centaurea solstitialis]